MDHGPAGSNGSNCDVRLVFAAEMSVNSVLMRSAILIMLLLICPGTAFAMNWEGHDDWMEEMAPAVIYEDSAPHAAPKPRAACPPPTAPAADNPYEQIPLNTQDCPVVPDMPKHLR